MRATDYERLRKFRVMRKRYLRKGRRTFRGAEWEDYLAELEAVRAWIAELRTTEGSIAYLYWIKALPDYAIAQRTYYSERQVRRIRHRIRRGL